MTRSHFGSIQYIKTGCYRIWWRQDGRRLSEYVHGTREDAERALALKMLEGKPAEITWEAFYDAYVAPTYDGLAAKTVDDYERTWRVELAPRIAGERVADMDWRHANSVLTSIAAPTVQRRAGALLKKMCNIAVRNCILQYNPVQAIQYAPHRPRHKALVECEQVDGFLSAIRGLKYEPLLLLMLGCGLRVEEACALCWEDVASYDFAGARYVKVDVSKALVVANSGKLLKSTKNTPSEREAICGEPFASRVLALADGKTGPLCPSGGRWDASAPEAWYTSPTTVSHNWRSWCEAHGSRHVTLENLRSSYATMMGEAMAPDSVVAGNMGHAGGTVKSRHYQRVTLRAKCMAADLLTDVLAATSTDLAP